jgi:D-alanine-D-alanine ligase
MKKILVIYGGVSFEHEISIRSAKTIIDNIDKKKYHVDSLYIDKDNNWLHNNKKIENIISFLKQYDKIFPIIHGNPVENGNLEGMLNIFNIPYVGTDLLGSIISYDKAITKTICASYNIPQTEYFVVNSNKPLKEISIPYPVIIKPAKCGSSIGINIANNIKEVNKYIKEAFAYDNKVVVEKYVKARELECAVLYGKASPIGEIKSANTFYDYESKYIKDSNLIIPAKLPKDLIKKIQDLSLKIFKILELKDLARIDFLYDYNNDILYFNEVNTMPGFTSISMYPLLFKESGISIKELITKLIENS